MNSTQFLFSIGMFSPFEQSGVYLCRVWAVTLLVFWLDSVFCLIPRKLSGIFPACLDCCVKVKWSSSDLAGGECVCIWWGCSKAKCQKNLNAFAIKSFNNFHVHQYQAQIEIWPSPYFKLTFTWIHYNLTFPCPSPELHLTIISPSPVPNLTLT